MRHVGKTLLGSVCALAVGVGFAGPAQSASLVDVCTGLRLDLPVLQPVANATSGLLGGLLDPVLNGITNDINVNLRGALSGQNIGISVLDQNGALISTPGNCNLQADTVVVNGNGGVALGGGMVSGLGGASNTAATAGDQNAIAVGNAATTGSAASAIALGLRGAVTATDGVAIGRDTIVGAVGGVALGSGSVAARAGLGGAAESYSGVTVASTAGAVSVGAAGAERQITNVAGGTQDTDAVNLRQLRSVGSNLASSLGGGAGFDASTGAFTGPTYALRGATFSDVGAAMAAMDRAIAVTAANNTGNYAPAVASGADALSVGNGSMASGTTATAIGTTAVASGDSSVAIGAGATASASNAMALGAGAVASRQNQVAVGMATSTYTLPGISSAASRAAQSGPTQFVTSDAAGNLATTAVDLRGIDNRMNGMDSRLSSLTDSVSALSAQTAANRRESRQGIAAAMSMSAAPMPSAAGRTTWSGNTALYRGEWAAGFSVAHRLDIGNRTPLALNAGFSMNAGSFGGARVGLTGEF